jgi:hypothetical protein
LKKKTKVIKLYGVNALDYEFDGITRVAMIHGFGNVLFFIFLIELDFVIVYFFYHIANKIIFEKKPCY